MQMTDHARLIDAEIKLGEVQRHIERVVREYGISDREWNLKTKRVNNVLGDPLWLRDHLLRIISELE